MKKDSFIPRTVDKVKAFIQKAIAFGMYCWEGVWQDPSKSLKTKVIKILNLSVHTFMDSDLQSRAASLTYRTLLAIVPAFALLLAIGRGFGLDGLLMQEIYKFMPAQHQAIETAMSFVDSYLKQASQGVFVGIGIVFLLWTIISLLGNIEDEFNNIWGVRQGRSLYRKITDYTAICLMIPILMVCSAGVNIFMQTMFDTLFGGTIVSPFVTFLLDLAPFVLICMAFTLTFLLIPNTKVRLKYALISGTICGIAFQVVEMLFISGQVYVTKYNAIYGSFAFLPLLLIWLQLSWLILLLGCTMTYSMQYIFHSTFSGTAKDIAPLYMRKLCVVAAAVIAARFRRGLKPMTVGELSVNYDLPIRTLGRIVEHFHDAGLVYYVDLEGEKQGISPAVNLDQYTLGDLLKSIDMQGESNLVPGFEVRYKQAVAVVDHIAEREYQEASQLLLIQVPVPYLKGEPKPDDTADVVLPVEKKKTKSLFKKKK